MTRASRTRRTLLSVLAVVALVVGLTACQPEQIQALRRAKGLPELPHDEAVRAAQFFTRLIEEEQARRARFVGTIHPVSAQRLGLSWRPGCPVDPAHLRLLRLSFWGVDGREHQGELIVHMSIAERMVGVFRTLWDEKFPIHNMETADRFIDPSDFGPNGEYLDRPPTPDTANTTSGFFCRPVTGGGTWSQHSYGLAVDINPVQNPYVRGWLVVPANGQVARNAAFPGTITSGDVVVRAMAAAGMKWGGHWSSLKDYMHFSTNGR
jgi:hypothetical protein